MERTAKWTIEWSSATSAGNDHAEYPDWLLRSHIIILWEKAHRGCNVDRLICNGSRNEEGVPHEVLI